jgi:A/G-specific adenine glycosylase
MPWRTAPAPYICWLSEIMLQQTTYQTVLPYYERFLTRFPTVDALAAAPESAVLKAWEGLGYYARARNLHKAARRIAADGWPRTAAEWAAVPGVGPYTAAALASVLAGEKTPVVDGNVARVFSRVWQLDDDFAKQPQRARLAARLQPYLDQCTPVSLAADPACETAPGIFNQAMMELGALVCTPVHPACGACPLARDCAARKTGTQADYPRRPARKPLPVRQVTAALITDGDGRVLLVENREGGLLKGLWDLPAVAPATRETQVFSHFRLELDVLAPVRAGARFVDPRRVPLTTAARKVLARANLLPPDGPPQ